MERLAQRAALVTGGGRGLGFSFAADLAGQGASVALMGRNKEALEAACATLAAPGRTVSVHAGDVAEADDVERVLDEVLATHGRLDIVVNNAGIADEASFLDATLDGWNRVIAVNLTGPFLVTQRAARRMRSGGSVINIASVDAHGADGPYASYVAAKAGLVGLTKAAATELAPRGIRVNSVSPGWTLTQMAEEATTPGVLDAMKTSFRRVPMGRMVTTDEVAAAVTFLASPAASGITGIDLLVDGGTLANLYILETLSPSAGIPEQS
jgi:meso-butanediol dehydrogenase / (S,S)-butanediol dehydrogenase / diacetyl reductase